MVFFFFSVEPYIGNWDQMSVVFITQKNQNNQALTQFEAINFGYSVLCFWQRCF